MPSDAYVIKDDVRDAEEACRHASLVSIREIAGSMELRFNNGVRLDFRPLGEGFIVIEQKDWRTE